MLASIGPSTAKWNNDLKSLFLCALFPCLLAGLVVLYFAIIGYSHAGPAPKYLIPVDELPVIGYIKSPQNMPLGEFVGRNTRVVLPVLFIVAGIWILLGLTFHEWLISTLTQAKPVQRTEMPDLYNALENLCISRGIEMPKLFVINSRSMNAYASGLSRTSFAITVTRGLVDNLSKDELEAVLAHELTHIMNHDVRLILMASLFSSMLSLIPESVWRFSFFAQTVAEDTEMNLPTKLVPIFFAWILRFLFIVLSVGYIASFVFRVALSKQREFAADAGSAELTKRPEALVEALSKIDGNADMPYMPCGLDAMLIESPKRTFFQSHPSIGERINALRMVKPQPLT